MPNRRILEMDSRNVDVRRVLHVKQDRSGVGVVVVREYASWPSGPTAKSWVSWLNLPQVREFLPPALSVRR